MTRKSKLLSLETMPRLSIEPREGAEFPITDADLVVKLDGKEVPWLQGLTLEIRSDEVNRLTMELAVGEVHVDAQVIQWLKARLDESEED